MQVFSIDDQYVVHDYDVMCNDVHIVYLRNLGKYSQGKISEDFPFQIMVIIQTDFLEVKRTEIPYHPGSKYPMSRRGVA